MIKKAMNRRQRNQEGRVNLRRMYPISHVWAVMKSSPLLVLFLLIFSVVSISDYYFVSFIKSEPTRDALQELMLFLVAVTASAWAIRFLFLELEMWHYDYRIENGHLNLNKGIFLKQKGSFPLNRITDIYLDRTVMDFVFGLWNVHVSTPTISSGAFAHIHGLSERNALALQKMLSELVQDSAVSNSNDNTTFSAYSSQSPQEETESNVEKFKDRAENSN